MKEYDVYFEIYGKKLKTKIVADSTKQAMQIVKDKIIFHKIIATKDNIFTSEDNDEPIDQLEHLKNMLGIKD